MYNNLSKSWGGGGHLYLKLDIIQARVYSPWKVVRGWRPLRPPFHALSSAKTPISACFSSLRPPFQQKSQFFTNFAVLESIKLWKFHFQSRKFCKISVPKPHIGQDIGSKFSSLRPYFSPKSVLSVPIFRTWPFFNSGFFKSPFSVKVGGGALVFEVGYHSR